MLSLVPKLLKQKYQQLYIIHVHVDCLLNTCIIMLRSLDSSIRILNSIRVKLAQVCIHVFACCMKLLRLQFVSLNLSLDQTAIFNFHVLRTFFVTKFTVTRHQRVKL